MKGFNDDDLNDNDFEELEDGYDIVALTDENGNEVEYAVIGATKHKDTEYLLIVELSAVEDEEADASIIKKIQEDNEDFVFALVEDDSEFEEVAALFADNNEYFDFSW